MLQKHRGVPNLQGGEGGRGDSLEEVRLRGGLKDERWPLKLRRDWGKVLGTETEPEKAAGKKEHRLLKELGEPLVARGEVGEESRMEEETGGL